MCVCVCLPMCMCVRARGVRACVRTATVCVGVFLVASGPWSLWLAPSPYHSAMLGGFSSMGVCGLSSGRPCPFALRVWQARADRWSALFSPLQSNTVTGFSSVVDLATASQQSRLALGLSNRRVMKSSAAHMIIKALTLGGLSALGPPPPSTYPPTRPLPLSPSLPLPLSLSRFLP